MDINRIIMAVFAVGALIGGLDYIRGNKWGFGEKFEEAIKLMPPTAFNMVGIICLSPSIAIVLEKVISPLFKLVGFDPGMLGGVLALDMGGFPLAMGLATDAAIGNYAGILVGCIFGCTLVFAIPFGMGVLKEESKQDYLVGVIIGLIAMPAGFLAGGLVQGLAPFTLIYQSLPVLILSVVLIVGLIKIPNVMIGFFQKLSKGLKFLIKIGLVIAAVVYLLGIETPYIISIYDGMIVVVNITLALLGSLPFAKLLQLILDKPLKYLGKKLKLQDSACAGILIGMVSAIPVYTMMDTMDRRSRIVVSTFLIDGMAILGAHLAYTVSNAPTMTGPMLVCKIAASIVGIGIAFIYTGKSSKAE